MAMAKVKSEYGIERYVEETKRLYSVLESRLKDHGSLCFISTPLPLHSLHAAKLLFIVMCSQTGSLTTNTPSPISPISAGLEQLT